MEIPRGFQPGAVPQKAAQIGASISPTQRALQKVATERAAARDLMGAGEIVGREAQIASAQRERDTRERERLESQEDLLNIEMESARIVAEHTDRISQPGYQYDEADDEELTTQMQELSGSARHDVGQLAARQYLQREQIRFTKQRDSMLRDAAKRDARDATREGADYALSVGNWQLAENAAAMGRDLGASIEWAEGVKRRADVGRGMEEFNNAWEGETFDEQVASATEFVDNYSNRANVNPQNRDAAVRAMRVELGIREKAHKSKLVADEQFNQAEALDNYRQTQRAVNKGEPYTEDQVNLMFDQGAFGPTDSTTAVTYKNNLVDSLNKVDRTAADLAAILRNDHATAPPVNTERTASASQLAFDNAANRGIDETLAAADAARQTGRVPRSTEVQVERGWRSGTADDLTPIAESLTNYANIQDNSPQAYWSLDRDTLTAMNAGYTLLKGLTPEQQAARAPGVARRVYDLMNVDDTTRDSRRQQWNSTYHRNAAKELKVRAEQTDELSVPDWWGFARDVPEKMPLQMREYFAESAKMSYIAVGDPESAWQTALKDTQQNWVATNINEDVEGLDGNDVGEQWQWQGVPSRYASQYRGAMSRDISGQTFMMADGTEQAFTTDDAGSVAINPFEPPQYDAQGRQVYRLSYKGVPLMGEFGPARWRPEFE